MKNKLKQQAKNTDSLNTLFDNDKQRGNKYSISQGNIWLNYSRNNFDDDTLNSLLELAKQSDLQNKIKDLFTGVKINKSEDRAVLHTLLRSPLDTSDKKSICLHQQLDKIKLFTNKIRKNNNITDAICIGIGGSELGVKTVYTALGSVSSPKIKLHFVANIDGDALSSAIKNVNLDKTLFIVTSKTFTTQETITNYESLKETVCKTMPEKDFMSRACAITVNVEKAKQAGFLTENIFEFSNWVGGRFSVWSTVGMPIALSFGMTAFREFLAGGNEMDIHFRNTEFSKNMPVLLALSHIYNSDYLNIPTRAVIPYADKLGFFPDFLQQLEMESLGKSVDVDGKPVNYQTCPIVWGSAGTNGQHAFFQLLHQGTQKVLVDFIAVLKANHSFDNQHNMLLANCLAQSQSLATGRELGENKFANFDGNKPSNLLLLDKICAKSLGELISLYEQKTFVQSVIWNINAFDQWGVELGKVTANKIMDNQTGNIDFETIKKSFN